MNIPRILRHLFTTRRSVTQAFPASALAAIEQAIKASEALHAGEIRFAVEAALDGAPLFHDQSPHDRAIDLFGRLRVWDTEHNNGLLIYLLLADHAVEIVADRGIHARVGAQEWAGICRKMEEAFSQSRYQAGVVAGVQAVTQHLATHFPVRSDDQNELSNQPVVL